jgi:uncharacterized phage-associated protein
LVSFPLDGKTHIRMALSFRPKLDKLVELMLHLAHTKPDRDKYQVVKLLYLADREHLLRYGRPITYERYVAMQYGPVASNAKDFLEGNTWAFKKARIDRLPFETEIVKNDRGEGRDTTYIRKPLRDVNYSLFSKSDIRVFDEIVAKYGDEDFDSLFNLTHDHLAWKRAWNERGYSNAPEMLYDEMIEDAERRAAFMEDIEPVAAHMT